jgi:hypothetical protein
MVAKRGLEPLIIAHRLGGLRERNQGGLYAPQA